MPDDVLTDLRREVLRVFFELPESEELVLAGDNPISPPESPS